MNHKMRDRKRVNFDRKKELALAIFLWKCLRCKYKVGSGSNLDTVSGECEQHLDEALEMARRLEVNKEYLAIVLNFPVTRIQFQELETWLGLDSALSGFSPLYTSDDNASRTISRPGRKPRKTVVTSGSADKSSSTSPKKSSKRPTTK